MATQIPLQTRKGVVQGYAWVDDVDAEFVRQWTWRLSPGGYAYRSERQEGRPVTKLLHRELLGLVEGDELACDHRNRDRLDCRRENLRILPRLGNPNSHNQSSNRGSVSRFRGVTWSKQAGKWKAQVNTQGKTHYFGYFSEESEAATAAAAGRQRLLLYALD